MPPPDYDSSDANNQLAEFNSSVFSTEPFYSQPCPPPYVREEPPGYFEIRSPITNSVGLLDEDSPQSNVARNNQQMPKPTPTPVIAIDGSTLQSSSDDIYETVDWTTVETMTPAVHNNEDRTTVDER